MSDASEWGPWIDHDGNGCPVKGQMVESELADGTITVHIAWSMVVDGWGNIRPSNSDAVDAWDWADCARRGRVDWRLLRYRVRKPKGMIMLQELLESLPSDVKAREPA